MGRSITTAEIARRVEEKTGVKPNLVKTVIGAIVEVAQDELRAGNEFSIAGLVKLKFRVSKAIKKGTLVRNPFDGTERKHEGRPAQIKPAATALSKAKEAMPSSKSTAGRAILASKK